MEQGERTEDDVILSVAEPIYHRGRHIGGPEVCEDSALGLPGGTRRVSKPGRVFHCDGHRREGPVPQQVLEAHRFRRPGFPVHDDSLQPLCVRTDLLDVGEEARRGDDDLGF